MNQFREVAYDLGETLRKNDGEMIALGYLMSMLGSIPDALDLTKKQRESYLETLNYHLNCRIKLEEERKVRAAA